MYTVIFDASTVVCQYLVREGTVLLVGAVSRCLTIHFSRKHYHSSISHLALSVRPCMCYRSRFDTNAWLDCFYAHNSGYRSPPLPPLSRVQSKVQVLQDQLSDALGDLSTARRREEAQKAELVHAATKLEHRGAELAKSQVA